MEREAAVKPPLFFCSLKKTRGSFQHNRKDQRGRSLYLSAFTTDLVRESVLRKRILFLHCQNQVFPSQVL